MTGWSCAACLHFVLRQAVRWFDKRAVGELADVEEQAEDYVVQVRAVAAVAVGVAVAAAALVVVTAEDPFGL